MKHELKTLPEFFEAIYDGLKRFEVRKNDRNFQTEDTLFLQEWSKETGYTGREIYARVGFILHGPAYGIQQGYCVMSLEWEGIKL